MHGGGVLGGCDAVLVEAKPLLHLLLQLLAKGTGGDVHEAVDPAPTVSDCSNPHMPHFLHSSICQFRLEALIDCGLTKLTTSFEMPSYEHSFERAF